MTRKSAIKPQAAGKKKVIEETISVFKDRTDDDFNQEDARQAAENICGFFELLQEWDEKEKAKKKEGEPKLP